MAASKALYRALFRTARTLERGQRTLRVRSGPDPLQWGRGSPINPNHTTTVGLRTLFPTLKSELPPDDKTLTPFDLKRLIRREFRLRSEDHSADEPTQLDEAFHALRVLNEQLARMECSSDETTAEIRVEATSGFISANTNREYMFTYQIRVTNQSDRVLQLLGRHWEIRDEEERVIASVPRGSPGVVGQTPILRPGESFQYSSGTGLPTASGSMSGSFQMASVDLEAQKHSEFFDVTVGNFRLDKNVHARALK